MGVKKKKVTISIVIPNNGRDISAVLNSIKGSSYKFTETIVVDEGKERSEQRNIGISKARGRFILILDSDQILHPQLLQECLYLMRNELAQGIYIPEIIPAKDWFSKLRNFERQFYTGTAVDCVRFVRNPCPLFDETMSGPEDTDWDRKIHGKKVVATYPFIHDDNVNFKQYIAKKKYYTKSMRRFEQLHPNDKILNIKWRCWTVFTENGKWKILWRHPKMALKLFMLIFIRGVIWLRR